MEREKKANTDAKRGKAGGKAAGIKRAEAASVEGEKKANTDAKAGKAVGKAAGINIAQAAADIKAQAEADGKTAAKRLEELERIAKRAKDIDFATLGVASASESDDLQMIKGVGPFIAEKLNALGIFTFEQIGNMTAEIEEQVNVAIEFFPGRVKRDDWADQAKQLSKN